MSGTVRIAVEMSIQAPLEQQHAGWQANLDNFARHVEAKRKV